MRSVSAKYPSTPYWPWSPAIARGDDVHRNPARFLEDAVVVTEKLDGGNTLLHDGKVYARSVSAPSHGKWMAMVKKHHAWKVREPDVYLYGEDIYGEPSMLGGDGRASCCGSRDFPPSRTTSARAFASVTCRRTSTDEEFHAGSNVVQGDSGGAATHTNAMTNAISRAATAHSGPFPISRRMRTGTIFPSCHLCPGPPADFGIHQEVDPTPSRDHQPSRNPCNPEPEQVQTIRNFLRPEFYRVAAMSVRIACRGEAAASRVAVRAGRRSERVSCCGWSAGSRRRSSRPSATASARAFASYGEVYPDYATRPPCWMRSRRSTWMDEAQDLLSPGRPCRIERGAG